MADNNRLLGLASAIGVIFVWSGFLVVARAGAVSGLTSYDITALRFIVAGALTLPFAWTWWPRHLPWHAQALLSLTGPGVAYSVLMYQGLSQASAAYGGVFANGSLPLFTMLLAALLARTRPARGQILGIAIIIAGGTLLAWKGLMAGGGNVAFGIALFLSASLLLAAYMYMLRLWAVTPKQALSLVNIPNALVFLPVWYLALPSTLGEADLWMIVLQALYQGMGPGFLAVILFSIATVHIGPTPTAGFSAAVPASAAVMAIPFLSEIPTLLEWAGIAGVTVGLLVLVSAKTD